MPNMKKWSIWSAVAFPVLLCGVMIAQPTLAGNAANAVTDKVEQLKNLKAQEQAEKEKLDGMEASTEEEIKQTVEQGKKVKDIGWEIGELEKEVNPVDERTATADEIRNLQAVLGSNQYYRDYVDHPELGPKYRKAYEVLQMKIKMLDQIEKDFNEGTKSIQEIQKELDELRKIQEL